MKSGNLHVKNTAPGSGIPGGRFRPFTRPCGETGFTLVEVLVVIVILVMTVGITLSSMAGSIKNIKLRTETKKFAASLRFTKNLAVTHGVPFVFTVGQDGQSYKIEPRVFTGSKTININGKIGQRLMSGIHLPQGLYIQVEEDDGEFQDISDQEDLVNKIFFYSKGNSSGKIFSVNHEKGKRYIVDVAPITGRIKVEGPYGHYN